jgi:hypothetical protein
MQATSQASTASLRRCLSAHLDPEIHLPSLARLLDVLSHVALLADKLLAEIARIRNDAQASFTAEDKISLRGVSSLLEEIAAKIWTGTTNLRELVCLYGRSQCPCEELSETGCSESFIVDQCEAEDHRKHDYDLLR